MTANRTLCHTRKIYCEGFERNDGLWDIEATLIDTKTGLFTNHERGVVPGGIPVHQMKLRVTLNLELTVQEVAIEMPYTPFQLCKTAGDKMDKLIGLRIKAGWIRQARECIGRTESCTHVMELLGPISTTAYQTMHNAMEEKENSKQHRSAPVILDQCKSLARDSEVVAVMWPEFHTPKKAE